MMPIVSPLRSAVHPSSARLSVVKSPPTAHVIPMQPIRFEGQASKSWLNTLASWALLGASVMSAAPQTLSAQPPAAANKATDVVPYADHGKARMNELAQKYPMMKNFFAMVDIPTPTQTYDSRFRQGIDENFDKLRGFITDYLKGVGVTDIKVDKMGNMIIEIPGTEGYEKERPLMLMGHLDVVPADRHDPLHPINRQLSLMDGEEYIHTDQSTTLGADDKGGIAAILQAVTNIVKEKTPHVPLTILLSPDEEGDLTSFKALATPRTPFKAKHIVVVDGSYDDKIFSGKASFVAIDITMEGLHGGHSAGRINDPKTRNAILQMGELLQKLGTGVIKKEGEQVLVSKNLAIFESGSTTNTIPSRAHVQYSLRSATEADQHAELQRMTDEISKFEKHLQTDEGQTKAKITMKINVEYPPYELDPNKAFPQLCRKAAQRIRTDRKITVENVHSTNQSNVIGSTPNAEHELPEAISLCANMSGAHSREERISVKSLLELPDVLTAIITDYTQTDKKSLEE